MNDHQPGWSIPEACAQFAAQGIPVDPARFRQIVRALQLEPVGEGPSSKKGGRGHTLYAIGELQRLGSALAPWFTKM